MMLSGRLLAAALALGAASTALALGSAPSYGTLRAEETERVKEIAVSWSGDGDRDYVESARVQGIGTIRLVCKPHSTIIKLTADSRVPETQMWLAKYEQKRGENVIAVKNARIYTYANADDDGTGGTSRSAHEGLNQQGHVENWARGYAYGLVSQRPGRHQPAGTAVPVPATSFYLTWYWNGMDQPRAYQSCDMRLRLVQHIDEPLGLNWHGDQDAAGNTVEEPVIPGLGRLRMVCEPGRVNEQTLTLFPEQPGGSVYAETITGEGRLDEHVESESLDWDSQTGTIGPLELPRNGMMRLLYTVPDGDGGSTSRWFYLSAYMVLNNVEHPELNVCEIAVGGGARANQAGRLSP